MTRLWRGIFPIVMTPFTRTYELDDAGLRKVVRVCIDAGASLLDEYRRGSVGNMPACQTTDMLQTVWDLLDAGQEAEGRKVFNRVLPLINYERTSGVAVLDKSSTTVASSRTRRHAHLAASTPPTRRSLMDLADVSELLKV